MKKGVVRITYGPHPFDIGVSKKNQSKKKKATTRSDVDKEQNLIKQKTAEKAWVTTK